MSCTTITVYNLSPEASNKLGGVTEVDLDIPFDLGLRLSKDVEKLSDVNQIITEGALGLSIPWTRVNDAAFSDFASPLTLDNKIDYYDIRVNSSGYGVQLTRLVVKEKNNINKEWEIELRRDPNHWIELASQVKLNELDFGTFELTRDNVISNWDLPIYEGDYKDPNVGQSPQYWGVVDYGGWADQTPVPQGAEGGRYKAVAVEDMRPLLSLPYILRAGFCEIGWNIEGVILDTDYFKRLWIYNLKPDYYLASKTGGRIIGRSFQRVECKLTISTTIRFYELVQGAVQALPAVGSGYLMGIYNFQGVALKYAFRLSADFKNEKGIDCELSISVMEVVDSGSGLFYTGESLSPSPLVISIANGQTKSIVFEEEVIMKPRQRAAIFVIHTPGSDSGLFMEKGAFFSVTPTNQSLMSNDVVTVSECVSDQYSILDWLKATLHLINGRIETNWETRTVTIYPNRTSTIFTEKVPGFLLDEEPAEDINDFIVRDSISVKRIKADKKRYTRFEFASAADAYIQSLNLSEPAHSRKINNGINLPNEVEAITNLLIQPTFEGQPLEISAGSANRQSLPYMPRMWDNTEGQRSFNIGPRILYAFGNVRQINPQPINTLNSFTSFFFDGPPGPSNDNVVTTFGYATMLPTWEFTPAPAVNANVVFGTKEFDLFVSFYLGQTRDGSNIDLLMWYKMRDYVGYNFRKMYAFNINGIPMRVPMTGTRDFDSCGNTPTPVTFFAPPSETECCDLPCGCRFTQCEYYSDFGIYMRQSTLSDLFITSFVVDGIELITTPIGFGNIKIIDIGGKQYITNLVDTLNSIAAPYFAFGYSTRESAAKGLRFFTIKHLLCQPFRILIQNGAGDDKYLYTQAEQKTQWFGGGWSPFGYGGESYDVPENCITTTEY